MGKFTGRKCRLICMFGLTTTFFLVEIVVGYVSNSMALVADSFHMLSDVAALVIAFVSIKMSPKKWSKSTFGWARAEVLGALVNAVFLVALCFSILVESLKRFYAIEEITNPELVLYVGSLGLLINLVGLGLFYEHGAHGHGHSHGGHGHSHGGHHKKQHKHGGGRRSEFVAQENEAAQQSDLEVHSKQIPAGEVGDGATGDAVMTNGARTLDNVANPLNGLVRVTSSPPQLAVETEGGRSRQRREETAAGKSEGNFRSSSSSDVSTSETEGSYDRNNMALLVAYIGVMKGGDPGALSHGQVKIGGDNGSQGKLTAVPSGECELENVRQRPTSPNGSPAKDDVEAAGSEGAGAGTKSGEGGTKVEVRQMNMRGIFLHVLADALGSVIVVISALVIWKTDWEYRFYLDPALSILMVLMILKSVWPLLVESAMVLLQTVPPHIRVEAIQNRIIQEVDGVLALHEFHVWQLTGDRIIASAHVRCKNLHDYKEISQKIKEIFHEEGIHSTTIQPEFAEEYLESIPGAVARGNAGNSCALDCPPNTNCAASTCCPPAKPSRRQRQRRRTLPRTPPSSCDEQLASPGIQNNLAYLFRWGCILSFLFSDTDTEEDQDFLRHRPGRRQHALHLRQRKSTTTVPSGLPSSENVTLTSSNRRSSDDADNSSSSADTDASPGSFPSFLPIRCSSAPSTCPTGVTTHALGSPKKSPKASALLTTEPLSNEPATIPCKQTDPVTVPVSVTGLNLLTDSVTENPVSVTGETPQDPPDTVTEDSGSRKPSHDRVVVM